MVGQESGDVAGAAIQVCDRSSASQVDEAFEQRPVKRLMGGLGALFGVVGARDGIVGPADVVSHAWLPNGNLAVFVQVPPPSA